MSQGQGDSERESKLGSKGVKESGWRRDKSSNNSGNEVSAVSVSKILHQIQCDPDSIWSKLEPRVVKQLKEIRKMYKDLDLEVTVVIEKPNYTALMYEPTDNDEKSNESAKYISIGTGVTEADAVLASARLAHGLVIGKTKERHPNSSSEESELT